MPRPASPTTLRPVTGAPGAPTDIRRSRGPAFRLLLGRESPRCFAGPFQPRGPLWKRSVRAALSSSAHLVLRISKFPDCSAWPALGKALTPKSHSVETRRHAGCARRIARSHAARSFARHKPAHRARVHTKAPTARRPRAPCASISSPSALSAAISCRTAVWASRPSRRGSCPIRSASSRGRSGRRAPAP